MAALRTAPQLARDIGVTASTVLRWARDGQIPCHRVGARVWFSLDEVNTATLRAATAPKVTAQETPEPQLSARLFEIVGRRAGRTSETKRKAERSQ